MQKFRIVVLLVSAITYYTVGGFTSTENVALMIMNNFGTADFWSTFAQQQVKTFLQGVTLVVFLWMLLALIKRTLGLRW